MAVRLLGPPDTIKTQVGKCRQGEGERQLRARARERERERERERDGGEDVLYPITRIQTHQQVCASVEAVD